MIGRNEDITGWASRVDTAISQIDRCCVQRVIVIESTASTMDAADLYAPGQTGVLLVASEQTAGRGQRGRRWHDGDRCTLPCTFVLDTQAFSPRLLSVLVGCAVHETIQALAPPSANILIKWPNDIVVREGEIPDQRDRKLAGILIEQHADRSRIGIGINCAQGWADWDDSIRDQSASISELGRAVSRLEVICQLIDRLSHWLIAGLDRDVRGYYHAHDAMIGTQKKFSHDGQIYTGVVEHLDPLDEIVVKTQDGCVRLPAEQTYNWYGQE
ncbi:MAG: biotin--[acetyl-CoA-carboxylase] ligase [Phycisphaerales bacterium]